MNISNLKAVEPSFFEHRQIESEFRKAANRHRLPGSIYTDCDRKVGTNQQQLQMVTILHGLPRWMMKRYPEYCKRLAANLVLGGPIE